MSFELNRKQFDVLVLFSEGNGSLSQRQIGEKCDMSVGTANRILRELTEEGLIDEGKITDKGLEALEPYRAKRAVFIAAGFGSRMVPVTLSTPKPLVRVNGRRIIDGLLDACLAAGIEEIYIVRGYLAENFDALLHKYPMIRFLENPDYNEANNISSAMKARDLMSNAYVLEADLLIANPKIIKKYHYQSDFLAIYKERSDDWCFKTKDNIITHLSHGGTDCWQEVGISYWNEEDGRKMKDHILEAYEMPGGKEFYFEQIPLKAFLGSYKVEICECTDEDIIEIDTFNELKKIDPTYDV